MRSHLNAPFQLWEKTAIISKVHILTIFIVNVTIDSIVAENKEIGTSPWTVEELIAAAERIIASDPRLFTNPESESNKELNVRLIRDYVVREFIPRPERLGREARFGLNHLVQLLAVRVLLRSQRWSLPAIKASFATTTIDELLNDLLEQVRPQIEAEYRKAAVTILERSKVGSEKARTPNLNPAQKLIERFKTTKDSQAGTVAMPLFSKSLRGSSAHASPPSQRMGNVNSKLHVELEPWCEVVIDAERAESLTPSEIERLGEALKSRLKHETAR